MNLFIHFPFVDLIQSEYNFKQKKSFLLCFFGQAHTNTVCLKFEYLKSKTCLKSNFCKFNFQPYMVSEIQIKVPGFQTLCLKSETKVQISDTFWPNMSLETKLFRNQTVIKCLKCILVQTSGTLFTKHLTQVLIFYVTF